MPFTFHSDPSHGWLEVSLRVLRDEAALNHLGV